jgi:hypothetical protein
MNAQACKQHRTRAASKIVLVSEHEVGALVKAAGAQKVKQGTQRIV